LHPWAGQDPTLYGQAYRHLVDVFRGAGATRVRWLWSPSAMTDASGDLIAMPYYPGPTYVDYVGFSAFLYWKWEEWSPSRQLAHAYRSPAAYFSRPLAQLGALGKPIIIPELGVDLYPAAQGEREGWLTQAAQQLVSGVYPDVVAVVYFDTRHNWDDTAADWRLSPTERQRFSAVFQTQALSRSSTPGDSRAWQP
jgi:beta-mannanase